MNLKLLSVASAAVAACAALVFSACCSCGGRSDVVMSENLPFDMPTVSRPAIPNRTANILDYGAVPDGATVCTDAFAAAIDALTKQGGGRVIVPAGVWYTGPIVLKDNIDLHLEQSALIFFSDDKTLYPLTQITFEGLNTWRCQSPISAVGVKNVAITGQGVIDGNGAAWRALKKDKVTARQWADQLKRGGIVSDDGRTWYPSESFKRGSTGGADQNVSTWAKTREDFETMRDF
ncbi:MAG: glycoside hydrolase family 28 protein, partial [Alistipes sp.]|nr:glycoside hydrolase family 28 protein [Alistipes sp.]